MAQLADYLSNVAEFEEALESCDQLLGEGSLYAAPLADCAEYPTLYTIAVATAAVAAADETVDLQLTAPVPGSLVLRRGDVLSFELAATPGTYVELTLTADVTVTDTAAVTADIEPAPAAVALADEACAFQRYEFCGVKNMPLDFNIQTEDVKLLKDGIQGSTTKTDIQPQMGIEFLLRFDDAGLWGSNGDATVFGSALNNVRFYAFSLRLNGEQFITGPCETTALSFQNQTAQIQKGTATLTYQPTWYTGPIRSFMSTAQQDAYNAIRRLWLLPAIV